MINKTVRRLWDGMKYRCASDKWYVGCTVGFLSYDEFERWAVEQVGYGVQGFSLDKDILVKGNRTYSAENCVFVPKAVNGLLINCAKQVDRGDHPVGVSLNKRTGNFIARLNCGSYRKTLGTYPTVREAFLAYKSAKEMRIKEVAEQYKSVIDPRTYAALVSYTVAVTD